MYIARVKFEIKEANSYEINKINELYSRDNITCKYRYTDKSYFEFILGNFDNKENAFEQGKQLYSSLLYLLQCEQLCKQLSFKINVLDFNSEIVFPELSMKHYIGKVGKIEPEKYYYCNHDFYNNYSGLEIYEIENDFFIEYDHMLSEPLECTMEIITNNIYNFTALKNLSIKYDDETYRIYKLLELLNNEKDVSIKVLILSIAYEYLSNLEINYVREKYNSSSNLMEIDKHYIEEINNTEEEISVGKKCRLFIEKYSKNQEQDKKTFNTFYSLRSKITHGEQISEKDNIYQKLDNAELLFLKLFRTKYNS